MFLYFVFIFGSGTRLLCVSIVLLYGLLPVLIFQFRNLLVSFLVDSVVYLVSLLYFVLCVHIFFLIFIYVLCLRFNFGIVC